MSIHPDLPTLPPICADYVARTGHSFALDWTDEDGYVVRERDRNDVVIANKVLGRFPTGEAPVRFVIDALRELCS